MLEIKGGEIKEKIFLFYVFEMKNKWAIFIICPKAAFP